MSFKVAMTIGYSGIDEFIERHRQVFARMGVEYVFHPCQTEDEIVSVARDADAIITVSFVQRMTRSLIERLDKCKLIQSMGAGYEGVDVAAATERGICVANVPDYCMEEVSDHAMALILACSRQVVQLSNAVRAGGWLPPNENSGIRSNIWPRLSRLKGQTLGLIGLGRIARALVPKAQGFGLKVIAYHHNVGASFITPPGVTMVDLSRLLKESDFVSLHAPLTDGTKRMIRKEHFEDMKRSAYFINTARGAMVDEKALCEALNERKIAGAALDVTDPEPMAADNPLLKMGNVIVTGHVGAISPEAWSEFWLRPIEEVGRILNAEWPRCLVNPQVKETFVKRWGPIKQQN